MQTHQPSRVALCPLVFRPIYKDYPWGGMRIIRHFHRREPPGIYAESWEISDHPDGPTVVAHGPWKGKTLAELMATHARAIMGPRYSGKVFPLLVKIIDARETLSVQIHPDDIAARREGGEPKTEVWFTLNVTPGSGVYAGLEPGTTRNRLIHALRKGEIEKVLRFVPLLPRDVILVPGGRVHAIGKGCLLLEVQRRSNTTFRLYDWDRTDQKNRIRPLHVRQALRAIRWKDSAPVKLVPVRLRAPTGQRRELLAKNEFFIIERYLLRESALPITRSRIPSAEVIFVVHGKVTIKSGAHSCSAGAGQTVLLPYALRSYTVLPRQSQTEFLIIRPTVPSPRRIAAARKV